MNKIFLIIQREYFSRVRKKSFIVMTILGPILMVGLIVGSAVLSQVDNSVRKIAIVDETKAFGYKLKQSADDKLQFEVLNTSLEEARKNFDPEKYYGLLYIPAVENPKTFSEAITIYSEKQPSMSIIDKVETMLERDINEQRFISEGIDVEKLKKIETKISIKTRDLSNKQTSSAATSAVGFIGGILIYLFIFIYGAQVMRGVMEEKMSRIVEVIASSVKPFQLMMGKIMGIALVGLTQFVLWIALTYGIGAIVTTAMGGKSPQQMQKEMVANQTPQEVADQQPDFSAKLGNLTANIPIAKILIAFVFYFLGGYLLYGALFAAIGSAVDSETDSQQFMLPVTLPLILAYIVGANAISNPDGPLAFWFSMIPFTSPIVMMVRLPFDVPVWQIAVSIGLLILGFIFTTWIASRIYRTGILMYGKKVNYTELWKWIRYSD